MNVLPKILPINELKNTAKISQTCHDCQVPIVITKNGRGDMVLMSIDLYEETMYKAWEAKILNDAMGKIKNGDKGVPVEEIFARLGMNFDEE